MKKKLLIFISLLISLNLLSQPTVKVFAFEQENLPGTKAVGVTDENGNPVKRAAIKKDYFIYLSFNKTYNIVPVDVFIDGKPFRIQSAKIKKAPVYYVNKNIPSNAQRITLVPATANKIISLQVGEVAAGNVSSNVQKIIAKNDVVIGYLWKNKKYFTTVKEIKPLEPVANE